MIDAPLAHVAGVPVEETLASLGPALLVAFGVMGANLRARLRPLRSRASTSRPSRRRSTPAAPSTSRPRSATANDRHRTS
jgi:hypothetical protein